MVPAQRAQHRKVIAFLSLHLAKLASIIPQTGERLDSKARYHPFFDEPTNTVSYIVADPATKEAAFFDPVLDYDPGASEVDTRSIEAMLRFAKERGYRVTWTLETHAHADH